MFKREWKLFIEDILESIHLIKNYAKNRHCRASDFRRTNERDFGAVKNDGVKEG